MRSTGVELLEGPYGLSTRSTKCAVRTLLKPEMERRTGKSNYAADGGFCSLISVEDSHPVIIEKVRVDTLDPLPESGKEGRDASRRRRFSYYKASVLENNWKNRYRTYQLSCPAEKMSRLVSSRDRIRTCPLR